MYSPRWLFFYPGLALILFGICATASSTRSSRWEESTPAIHERGLERLVGCFELFPWRSHAATSTSSTIIAHGQTIRWDADSSPKGLRVYMADRLSRPVEVIPPPSPRKYWTRKGIAEMIGSSVMKLRSMSGIHSPRSDR